MIIKTKYKPDLTDTKILKHRNILSWKTKSKDEYLEINELGWGFIWLLIKRKIKTKIYLLVVSNQDKSGSRIEFFSTDK